MLDSTAPEMARRGSVELLSLLAKRLQGMLRSIGTPSDPHFHLLTHYIYSFRLLMDPCRARVWLCRNWNDK